MILREISIIFKSLKMNIHNLGLKGVFHPTIICSRNVPMREMKGSNIADSGGTPQLGDYVDIGVSAIIIGDISLASHTKVAANSVGCKSFATDY